MFFLKHGVDLLNSGRAPASTIATSIVTLSLTTATQFIMIYLHVS